jgi:transposase
MENKRTRRTFTKEFKVQAVELAESMESAQKAAEKLGIQVDSIRLWRRQLGRTNAQETRTVAQAMADAEEIKKLKKQISDLEKTNYILKKAAAFFSQDHLK